MHVIYRTLKITFYSLLITLLLLATIVLFLLGTTPGLWTSIKIAQYIVPGNLRVNSVKGNIFNHIGLKEIAYSDKDYAVNISNLDLNWSIADLLKKRLTINNLQVDEVNLVIVSKEQETVTSDSKLTLPHFNLPHLPLSIVIHNADINRVKINQINSTKEIEKIHLQANLTNQQWQFQNVSLITNGHIVQSDAVISSIMPYPVTASAQIQPAHLTQVGLNGQIHLSGNFLNYSLTGQFTNPTPFTVKGNIINGSQLNLVGNWENLTWPLTKDYQFVSEQGQLKVNGELPNLTLALNGQIKEPLSSTLQINAATTATGAHAKASLLSKVGNVNLDLSYDNNQLPHLKGNLKSHLADEDDKLGLPIKQVQAENYFSGESLPTLSLYSQITGRYNDSPVKVIVHYNKQTLEAAIDLGPNHFQVNGSAPFPWNLKASIPQPSLLHPYLNGLNTTITAEAALSDEQKGDLQLSISKGEFKTPEFTKVNFAGGNIVAKLDETQLRATGNLILDDAKKMLLSFSLPKFNYFKGDLKQQSVNGNLQLIVNSLAFLSDFSPEIKKLEGHLGANLKVTGTLGKPTIDGEVQLTKASIAMPSLGINLNPIQLTLLSSDKKWQVQGEAVSGGVPLFINGKGEFMPSVKGALTVKGEHVPLISSKEYLINISPNLNFEFTPSDLKMKGQVLIPKAIIKPQTFSNSVSLTDDVVFVDKKESPNPYDIDTDVKIEMGDDVMLTVKGLEGHLIGAVNLRQLPQGPLTATGKLDVKDGKYQAYGQDLTIEKGQLLFTGGLINNPAIQVRAIRKFNNTTNNTLAGSNHLFDFNSSNIQTLDFGKYTTVGIEVKGRLSKPKVELFSVPSTLSQADILSMLLLGRPANQADKSGAQLILAAVSALNLDSSSGGTQLLSQLKKGLGIDFNIENNIQYNQKTNESTDKTSLVIGKSLSKRLYLSYNVGLSKTDTNVLTLKYLLNKFFSVQVNASTTGSGIDLFYTHQKD
ncbi:translocation/assembly module TamB domain-containing protein [Legionella gresilensis]|uniref:translocation/assembly module TamB domain-containing protein n=1 Tax=Legionella gresilensis TaxID=91823 RepID=UPI0010417754|nr:translocation/assembly module TamB domain-containing protein [Legionella gresilensis]